MRGVGGSLQGGGGAADPGAGGGEPGEGPGGGVRAGGARGEPDTEAAVCGAGGRARDTETGARTTARGTDPALILLLLPLVCILSVFGIFDKL